VERLLQDVVIIFGLSIVVLLLCHRIGIPSIVGFLFTGVLCGPFGLGFVAAESSVEILASVGLVLLLFSIGMEFSFDKILLYKRYFLLGGMLQVGLTVLVGMLTALAFGRPFGESLLLGFLLSMSSTAVVLRVLDQKGTSDSPHGHVIIGIMIFQDIIAVPMMLCIPLLGETGNSLDSSFVFQAIKGLVLLVLVMISARYIVPKLFDAIAKTRSRELFLLSVLAVCFSVAWMTSSIGLSLSLGAFLAGLIVSETEYKNEAVGDIIPFQDIFTSFFFVSIGMLLDMRFVIGQPIAILFITLSVLIMKAFLAGLTTLVIGLPLRIAVLAGISLCQVGEFSFVLIKAGDQYGLVDEYRYQLFLAVALLSMALTPNLIDIAPWVSRLFLKLPISNILKTGFKPAKETPVSHLKDHVIIIGFGLSGRHLARSAKEAAIPYTILEMNPETVKNERKKGEPIHFGDATHPHVLQHARIDDARALAVVINDGIASARIVEAARKLNPKLYIIVRIRYFQESGTYYRIGADEVIPDEFGSSVEVFTRVLKKFQVPHENIEKFVTRLREEGYEMFRLLYRTPGRVSDLNLSLTDVAVETIQIEEGAALTGKNVGECSLRKQFGLTIMMIRRGTETITSITPETVLYARDVLVVVGTRSNLNEAAPLFKNVQFAGTL
jgi:CPA2 family monovalent cation:H+ antiporter-2